MLRTRRPSLPGRFGAALIACAALCTSIAETASAQPAPQTVKMATTEFTEGKKAFEAGQFSVALQHFQKSYELVASPNSHIYIARCQDKLGDPKQAFRTFQIVIQEADLRAKTEAKYGPTRDSAKNELADLANRIGIVVLNVHADNPAASVKMNGVVVRREDWAKEIPADPGPTDVTLEVPGQPVSTQHVTVAKGQRQTIELSPGAAPVMQQPQPQPQPEPQHTSKPPYLPVAIAFTVVGVGGFAMAIAGGVMSKSTFNDLSGKPRGTTNADEVSKGKTQQLVANIGFGIGAVGLAAGGTFFILAATSKGHSDEHAGAEGPSIAVDLSPSYAGVHGTF